MKMYEVFCTGGRTIVVSCESAEEAKTTAEAMGYTVRDIIVAITPFFLEALN